MAEVTWIKLMIDMFDNPKVKQIRRMPEGNNIVLIWVMLLTIAGRCNADGNMYLTQDIGYTLDALADELRFTDQIIKLAIETLTKYGMIECNEDIFRIKNWAEYQNLEGMERIREANRLRNIAYRERKKAAALPAPADDDITHDITVMSHDGTEEDIEEDKDIKKEKKNNKGVFQEFAGEDKALLEALKEFNSFRNLKKKPMTDAAKRRLVNKLEEKFPKEQWIDIIHQSIDNGWTDIYGLKGSDRYDTKGSGQKQSVHTNAPESSGSGGKQWNLKHN